MGQTFIDAMNQWHTTPDKMKASRGSDYAMRAMASYIASFNGHEPSRQLGKAMHLFGKEARASKHLVSSCSSSSGSGNAGMIIEK